MISTCIFFLFLHLFHISRASDQTIWTELSSNTSFCCNLPFKESEALQLRVNDQRLSSLVKRPGSGVKKYISQSTKGWIVNVTNDNDICLTKVGNRFDEMYTPPQIICEKAADEGLGETLEKKSIILKFYEQVKIVEFPKSLKLREGSSQIIECSATGFPGLYVIWRLKNGAILKKSQQSTLSSVNANETRLLNLPLELSKIRSDQHGSIYLCEAGLNSTVPHKKATEEVMLEVTYLGVEEKFNILVTGYPTPTLKCNDLPVGDGYLLSKNIQGGIWVYPVVFSQITPQHLHEYLCIANNSLGSAIQKLEITVAPAPPTILSSNSSEYADYYLLHWKTTSRAPLKNVTVTVSEVSTNTESGGGSIVPRSPTLFERVFNLEDDKIDLKSTLIKNVSMQSSNPTNSKQIWHHLTNLSSNTRHDISLSVCNAYACTKSSSLKGRPGGLPGKFTFKTPEFDG
ncbi:hypothetical protein MN116_008525, partial [Schistosoma mekongi]